MEPQGTPPQAPQQTPPPQQPDEYETASRSTADYINSLEPIKKQQKQRRKRRLVLIVIALLAVLGAGGYFVYNNSKKPKTPEPTAQTQQPAPAASTVDSELSEHYVSQSLMLALDYPKTWTKDDQTQGQLKLQAPNATIMNQDGTKIDGRVTITIVTAGSSPTGFVGNAAKAVAESKKMAYKQPSQTQRKETYLSFLGYGTSRGANAVNITGDFGYKKDQDIPKTDIAKGDPIVTVSFSSCDGGECDQPLVISPEAWGSDEILKVTQSS